MRNQTLLEFLEQKVRYYESEHKKTPSGQKGHDLELISNEIQGILNEFMKLQKEYVNYESAWAQLKNWLGKMLNSVSMTTIAAVSVLRKMNEYEGKVKVIIETRRCPKCLLTKPSIFVKTDSGVYLCHSCYRRDL